MHWAAKVEQAENGRGFAASKQAIAREMRKGKKRGARQAQRDRASGNAAADRPDRFPDTALLTWSTIWSFQELLSRLPYSRAGCLSDLVFDFSCHIDGQARHGTLSFAQPLADRC